MSSNTKIEYFHSLSDNWDEMVGNNSDRAVKIAEIFSMIEIKPGDSVLDVGSGNGILIRFIEEKTGSRGKITALDPAQGMIDKAKTIYAEFTNIDYVTGLIENAPLPLGQYDVVLCYAVLPHIDDIPSALIRINKLLRQDGRLYIFHPSCTKDLNEFHSSLNAPVKNDMLPVENEMKAILSDAGFKVESYIDKPGLNFVECCK